MSLNNDCITNISPFLLHREHVQWHRQSLDPIEIDCPCRTCIHHWYRGFALLQCFSLIILTLRDYNLLFHHHDFWDNGRMSFTSTIGENSLFGAIIAGHADFRRPFVYLPITHSQPLRQRIALVHNVNSRKASEQLPNQTQVCVYGSDPRITLGHCISRRSHRRRGA